jgi:phosphoribosylaminoimidazole carboxylase PurE protein
MTKEKIAIILGGHDDENIVNESGMLKILERLNIPFEYSIISSDQHLDALRVYCMEAWKGGVRVFICIAGLVPALPGAVKSILPLAVVISVPLTSQDFAAQEIILASLSVPSKRPVIVLGVNKSGLKKAAYLAVEILGLTNDAIQKKVKKFLEEEMAKPLPRLKEFPYGKT